MNIRTAIGVTALVFCHASYAQEASNVIIYGLVDTGLSYYSDSVVIKNGKIASSGSAFRLDNGIAAGNRLGFTGTEDIGGGWKAVFRLENGFDSTKGSLGQGGLLFGRQAYVGLMAPAGLISAGRQYDFMFDYLNLMGYTNAGHNNIGASGQGLDGMSAIGATALLGNHTYGARINDSIKFSSNSFSGFKFGVMVGAGEQPGALASGSTVQAGINYADGNLSVGAVAGVHSMPDSNGRYEKKRLGGVGAKYTMDKMAFYGSYTMARFDGLISYAPLDLNWRNARANTFDIGLDYQFSAVLNGGLSWQHQTRNGNFGSADQVTASVSYSLSRRTALYTTLAYQRDRAFGALNVFGAGTGAAGNSQVIARAAVRTSF